MVRPLDYLHVGLFLFDLFEPLLIVLLLHLEDEVGELGARLVQNLVDGDPGLEATPQFYPTLDGAEARGYGGFAFRKEDQALRDAFNDELAEFVGSSAHWALVEPFGFGPDMAPEKTAEQLCAG